MSTKSIPGFYSVATSIFLVVAAMSAFALRAVPAAAAAGGLAAQTSRGGGVYVTVTPRSLARDATVWEFDVAFDTHTVTLTGDPAQFASLIDGRGRVHRALAWKGDPPGGHHRKGVLQFKPLVGEAEVELRLEGVAGVPTRSFRWRP